MSDVAKVQDLLLRHEGLRLKPYLDSRGFATIGVGRCLETQGISQEEAMYLLNRDIIRVHNECHGAFTWFSTLNHARKAVIISMVFNLGLEGVKGFRRTLECLDHQDYQGAASEMLRSEWSTQVGARALELAKMMRTGDFQ